jgi:fructose-1,6-bisphosphatase/inositol monophosphatase family enzyme
VTGVPSSSDDSSDAAGAVPDGALSAVLDVMRDAGARAILPRWRALVGADVRSKATADDPDDVVTVADLEAERIITAGLLDLAPDVPVIGEEAVAADPSLLEGRTELAAYWLVDPIDGTRNFVEGSPDYGVMVALVEGGGVTASWIWLPVRDVAATARRGQGTWLDGRQVDAGAGPVRGLDELRGWVARTFLPADVAAQIRPEAGSMLDQRPPRSAAVGYVGLLEGTSDLALFWRTHPWDHAPGSLLAEEAGGAVRRLDGTAYRPAQRGDGLLVVRDERTWGAARAAVLGDASV